MSRTATWERAEAAAYDVLQTHLPEYAGDEVDLVASVE